MNNDCFVSSSQRALEQTSTAPKAVRSDILNSLAVFMQLCVLGDAYAQRICISKNTELHFDWRFLIGTMADTIHRCRRRLHGVNKR